VLVKTSNPIVFSEVLRDHYSCNNRSYGTQLARQRIDRSGPQLSHRTSCYQLILSCRKVVKEWDFGFEERQAHQ